MIYLLQIKWAPSEILFQIGSFGLHYYSLMFVIAFSLGYKMELSLTVSISLLAVIVFAALVGAFIPLTLEKYKIDPALATGPFITTVNDVLGLFIYFWIGKAIL